MAHLTNFFCEVFNAIFTEDASLPLEYRGAIKSKMTKNLNQGGGGGQALICCQANLQNYGCTYIGCLRFFRCFPHTLGYWPALSAFCGPGDYTPEQ